MIPLERRTGCTGCDIMINNAGPEFKKTLYMAFSLFIGCILISVLCVAYGFDMSDCTGVDACGNYDIAWDPKNCITSPCDNCTKCELSFGSLKECREISCPQKLNPITFVFIHIAILTCLLIVMWWLFLIFLTILWTFKPPSQDNLHLARLRL